MRFSQAVTLGHNWLLKPLTYNKWEVMQQFIWYIDFDKKTESVIVPIWFITDLWSIPSILKGLIPATYVAFICHDYLYSEVWEIKNEDWMNIVYNRKEADHILMEALKVEGMWRFDRWLVYIGVRLFGKLFFKN